MKTVLRSLLPIVPVMAGLALFTPCPSPAGCITIICPDILITNVCSNCVIVTYSAIAVTDACCTNGVTVTYDPPQRTCFDPGTHTVEVRVTDDCGNAATNYFKVDVISNICDNCNNRFVYFLNASNLVVHACGDCTVVHYPLRAIDPTCGENTNITPTFDPPDGSCLLPGITTVSCVAVSDCGNCGHTNFTVTVIQDTNPPAINCPSNIMVMSCTNSGPGTNLVPNPGFETYTSCPTVQGQITLATPWFSVNASAPDYYNTCAGDNPFIGVPINYYTGRGELSPHSGQGYAGIIAMDNIPEVGNSLPPADQSERTYLEVKLTNPLVAGHKYQVGFYASHANLGSCAIDNLGAYLSVKKESQVGELGNGAEPFIVTPTVRNPAGNFLLYTNWTLIEGTYTATGGESYLTIGNFYPNSATPTEPTVSYETPGGPYGSLFAYYFIDDVSVAEEGTSGCSTISYGPANLEGNEFVVNSCTNVPVYYNATASSSTCTNVTVVCTPPSGTSFAPNSTNMVKCVATDCCGNSNSCSFTVVVLSNCGSGTGTTQKHKPPAKHGFWSHIF